MVIHTVHPHLDAAIVQHQDVAGADIVDQLLVVDANPLLGAGFFVHGRVQHEALAGGECDLVVGEPGNSQLGPLEVREQRHEAALGGGRPRGLGARVRYVLPRCRGKS